VQRLLLFEEPILETPELRAAGLDLEMEALRIARCPSLLSRLGGIDLDVGQHGRFPSKAGSIREHQKEQHSYEALVTFAGCDKPLPGMMMAMPRLNVPSMFVYGGFCGCCP
jgi:hypothetical protein